MPSSTPNKAIPYAIDNDARALWPSTSQDVAERVDELLTAMDTLHRAAVSPDAQTALPNNAWADVAYSITEGSPEITYDGVTMTYTGPPRWFLLCFGANVAVNGSQPSAGLRLLVNGSIAAEPHHSDNYDSLAGAVPLLLGAGASYQSVALAAWANDGSGGLGGAYDRAYLRIVTLA